MSNNTQAKILYVDDDPILRQLISFVLKQRSDWEIQTASNGYEGVKIALEELPDLILMDLVMPTMDGFQATAALRANPRTRHIPIVAFTAYSMKKMLPRIRAGGINDFIQKIISPSDLIDSLCIHLKENFCE